MRFEFNPDTFLQYRLKNLSVLQEYSSGEIITMMQEDEELQKNYEKLLEEGYRSPDHSKVIIALIITNIQRRTYQDYGEVCLRPGYVFRSYGMVRGQYRITFEMEKIDG